MFITKHLKQPTRTKRGQRFIYSSKMNKHWSLFGLALSGVYLAAIVTICAVRSYRTFSPFPDILLRLSGSLFSVALSVSSHCPGVTWHFAHRARTFLYLKKIKSYKQRLPRPTLGGNNNITETVISMFQSVIMQVMKRLPFCQPILSIFQKVTIRFLKKN